MSIIKKSNPFKSVLYYSKHLLSNFVFCFLFIACPVISYGAISVAPASTKVDSLKALVQTHCNASPDTICISALFALSTHYINTAPDTGLIYAEQALQLANTVQWQQGIANAHHSIEYAHFVQGNFATCLHHWNKALEIRKQLAESPDEDIAMAGRKGVSASLGSIGSAYWNQGDYPKALSYFFQSLEMDSVMGNKNGVATHLGNIGIVYHERGDYPKALSYFFQALEMDSVMGDKRGIAMKLGNIGVVYKEQGDYPKALSYYFRSLEMNSVMGNKKDIAIDLGNIGIVYKEQGDYPKALSYYFRSLEMNSVLGNKKDIAINFGNIGALYTKIKQYDNAEQYLMRSLALSDSIGALHETMNVEKSISELYAQTNKWQKAYNHHLLYRNAKDTVFGEEKTKAIGRVEMKHEMEMAEYLRQQEEKAVGAALVAALAKRNLLQYSAILIGFFVFLGGILLLSRLLLSRLHLPVWLIEFISFVPFLILFEFLLVLTETWLDGVTGGAPLYRLLFNGILAGLLYPVQQFSKTRMKRMFYTHTE